MEENDDNYIRPANVRQTPKYVASTIFYNFINTFNWESLILYSHFYRQYASLCQEVAFKHWSIISAENSVVII